MDLFGEVANQEAQPATIVAPPSRATVEWSFSRRNVLETCPRKYYYQYYGGKQEKRGSPKELDSLRFLKMLSNQHLVSGKIAHELIRLYLTKAKEGATFKLDRLQSMAREKVRQSITFSENYVPGAEKNNPYLSLLELLRIN